ncbi:MAG: Tad domain-containing protein [Eubacteriales bacterium]|nr:Tad domain-containing protein [Eubacteriales bacterium]
MGEKERNKRNKRGSALIIVTVSVSVLLTMAALVVDLGLAYYQGSKLQNAADAAVFAGGRLLPADTGDTEKKNKMISIIEEYLLKNDISDQVLKNITFTDEIAGTYYGIDLSLNMESKTGFAKILGIDQIPIEKKAGVLVRPSLSATDVVPVSVVQSELDALLNQGITDHIILKFGGGDGTEGAYGAINLSGVQGGGASQYSNWVLNGYTSEVSVGETMYPIEPGNMAGPTSEAFNFRYTACTHYGTEGGCTKDHFEPTCPRVVKIPVVEYVGSKYVLIKGFAVFILEDCYANGNAGEVQGTYVQSVIGGTADFIGGESFAAEYGAYCITLSH